MNRVDDMVQPVLVLNSPLFAKFLTILIPEWLHMLHNFLCEGPLILDGKHFHLVCLVKYLNQEYSNHTRLYTKFPVCLVQIHPYGQKGRRQVAALGVSLDLS